LDSTAAIGSIAVVVGAENEQALQFYRAYGFFQFPEHPTRLFLPMQTIRDLFAG